MKKKILINLQVIDRNDLSLRKQQSDRKVTK